MIIGFALDEIKAVRKDKAEGVIQVNYSSKVTNVVEEEVSIYKDKVTRIEFLFDIEYTKEKTIVGEVHFSGAIVWKGDIDEIKREWKNKKLPEKLKSPILNYLYKKCLIHAIGLSESMGLPTPVPMPRIEFKNEKK